MDFSKYATLAGPPPTYEIPEKVWRELDRVYAKGELGIREERFIISVRREEAGKLRHALLKGLAPLGLWVTIGEPGYGPEVSLYIRRKRDTDTL